MIFSLLKIRKKTAAVLAGVLIGSACLWGIARWQGLSVAQLLNLFVGSLLFIVAIMLAALLLIALVKLVRRIVAPASSAGDSDRDDEMP